MSDNTLDILKNAILLETRGRTFYRTAAEQSQQEAVKEFFEMMAVEEESHIEMLSKQYKSYKKDKTFAAETYAEDHAIKNTASEILNKAVKEKISGAGFESAAISAAISMEERAIKLYSERAESANDPEEIKLYTWLSEWERGHLNILMDMDKELTQSVWNDNQFWPF